MGDEVFLLDSNILVYAYDSSAGSRHATAKDVLESCFEGKVTFGLSLQNLNEFYVIVTTKIEYPLEREIAFQRVKNIMRFHGFKILVPTPRTILTAIHLNATAGNPYWDCFLASTMLENGIYHMYTENTKDFARLPGIVAVNPFA